jgi:flagellar hook-associated protein 2
MPAVTFSGFNNIDFSAVVDAIMQQESQPLTALQTQKSDLDTQKTAFGTLATKLSAVQSAVESLTSSSGVTALAATSSDSGVAVSASGGSVEGNYDVVVSALARRQVTASTSTYSSANVIVATGGALTLTGADGTSKTISVGTTTTVKDLVTAINAAADSPVTASLVQSTPGSWQVVLTGRQTGAANAFTVSSTLTGGTGLTFTDTDGNGLAGDTAADNVQIAKNAELTVNGLPIVSASNDVNDVVPGVTLTLTKEDPTKTVAVTVSRDTSAAADSVQQLITAYNTLVGFINDQRTAATNGQTNIARDPTINSLKNSLRAALLGPHANSGSFSRLAEVGIGFDQSGKMVLDQPTFENALNSNAAGVQTLFGGDDGTSGAFGAINSLIDNYTKSGGLVATVRTRLDAQMSSLANRIDALSDQLDRRRLTLQQEYQAADEAMAQLNAQSGSLSNLGNEYRLF